MAHLALQRGARGFTLIELLVAISIMAMMAVMGWRALAGMQQATEQTRTHTDAVLTLEAGMAQWAADLDAMTALAQTSPMAWDGRALRLTRRSASNTTEGVLVVAWTRGERDGVAQWLRWQSTPLRTRVQWQLAWSEAATWAQSPTDAARQREVAIAPLAQWQIYYHRGGTWSNPLSSGGKAQNEAATPDGIRIMLSIAAPHPLQGTVVRDWANPLTLGAAP